MERDGYILKNKKTWNDRVAVHLASAFYDVEGFLKGKSSLNDIELALLGNVAGKSILHLQCHFGQDSISLARMGASVTGVDFSEKAIGAAEELAAKSGVEARFICSDIYELPQHLDQHFDLVFTSYGTIGWLPDIEKWAYIVSKYLAAGGQFVFVEFHPVVWMFDNDFREVAYHYSNVAPIIESTSGTYTNPKAKIKNETVSWNHSLSEVIGSLLKYGLEIVSFNEYDYSPYNCFSHTIEPEPGKFRIKHMGNKIPMLYAISAIKKHGSKKSVSRGV